MTKLAPLAFAAGLFAATSGTSQVLHDFTNFANPDMTYFQGTWALGAEDFRPRPTFSESAGAFLFGGGKSDIDSKVTFFFTLDPSVTPAFDAGENRFVGVSLKLLAGNQAKSLSLSLIDTAGVGAQAVFDLSSFSSTAFTRIAVEASPDRPEFNWNSIQYFVLSGGEFSNALDIAFALDQLSMIPEPSTYAALAGVAAFGVVAWRRRSKR